MVVDSSRGNNLKFVKENRQEEVELLLARLDVRSKKSSVKQKKACIQRLVMSKKTL